MNKKRSITDSIAQHGLLPLFYNDDPDVCISIMIALYDSGIRCIEFTNRGTHSVENFERLVKERNKKMKDLWLGVGTIMDPDDAKKFHKTGADFLVSPVYTPAINDFVTKKKIFWIPGCMTPTEILVASEAGSDVIKLFPGNVLKPSFVEAIRQIFPKLRFIVTGGVEYEKENIRTWFRSGVMAIGMGSKLINTEGSSTDWTEKIKQKSKDILSYIRDHKNEIIH